jgi:hypothetical protein
MIITNLEVVISFLMRKKNTKKSAPITKTGAPKEERYPLQNW